MAKKRKPATKKAAKKPSKAAAKSPTTSRKFSSEDQVTALVIAVAIVIVFAALYLYQNAKPKAVLLDTVPAIVAVEEA